MNSDFIAVFNFIREVRHLPEQVREEFLTYKCNYYQFFIRVALVFATMSSEEFNNRYRNVQASEIFVSCDYC